jgi:hypothetical protein
VAPELCYLEREAALEPRLGEGGQPGSGARELSNGELGGREDEGELLRARAMRVGWTRRCDVHRVEQRRHGHM